MTQMVAAPCPVFFGSLDLDNKVIHGRWGFGESATQTARFEFRALPSCNQEEKAINGQYEGYFELKENGERREIKDKLLLKFEKGDNSIKIKGDGSNAFGQFSMAGECCIDGSSLRIERHYVHLIYAGPKGQKKRKGQERTPKTRAARTAGIYTRAETAEEDTGGRLAMIFDRAREQCPKVQTVDTNMAKLLVEQLTQVPDDGIAPTMKSEREYDDYTGAFVEAFDNGNYPRLWKAAETAIDKAVQIAITRKNESSNDTISQIVRLVLTDDELTKNTFSSQHNAEGKKRRRNGTKVPQGPLAALPPQNFFSDAQHIARGLSGSVADAACLRAEIEPTNPGAFHINTIADCFGHSSAMGLDELVTKASRLAGSGTRAVILDARIKPGSQTEKYCNRLAALAQMHNICPASRGWRFGPGGHTLAGGEDRRHYLILGFEGGLTPTHCDFGVQTVLYHTLTGCNRVLGVPREVAVVLHALRESLVDKGLGWSDHCDTKLLELESTTLIKCLNAKLLEYDEFYANETMLILPRGGHAVLTGHEDKVVLAGEWHLLPDGRAATAVVTTAGSSPHQTKAKNGRSAGRPLASSPAEKLVPKHHLHLVSARDNDKNVNLRVEEHTTRKNEMKSRRRVVSTDSVLHAESFDDTDIIELRLVSISAILLTARRLKSVDLRLHLRPSWDDQNPERWIEVKGWDRVALETDLKLARDSGIAVCVVGNLALQILQQGVSHIMLDEEQLARHIDELKPGTRLALCAPAFDAVSGFLSRDDSPHTLDRAQAAVLRLSSLGLVAAYTQELPSHLFESLATFARRHNIDLIRWPPPLAIPAESLQSNQIGRLHVRSFPITPLSTT